MIGAGFRSFKTEQQVVFTANFKGKDGVPVVLRFIFFEFFFLMHLVVLVLPASNVHLWTIWHKFV